MLSLNEEESNLHEGESAAKHGPNLSLIFDSDSPCIARSLNPLFSEGEPVRVWSLFLIGFRRIPRRILLSNLLQLQGFVEKVILSLLFVRLGCNMRRVTCVATPRARVAALVYTSPLF